MHRYSIVVSFHIVSPKLMLESRPKDDAAARSWLSRLSSGLTKTRLQLSGLFDGRAIQPALFEELESALLASDAGVEATRYVLGGLRERTRAARNAAELKTELQSLLLDLLGPLEQPLDLAGKKPCVIMLAGVNGAGKTTSIGKLAAYFQNQGRSVLLAAGDTFRAAAREQLAAWGYASDVAVIAQSGGDPAAVAYDAVERLRDLLQQPSLEGVFAQLTEQEDSSRVVRSVLAAIQS